MFKYIFFLAPLLFVSNIFAATTQLDTDHDGVADKYDRCPETAQLKLLPKSFRFAVAVNPERLSNTPKAHPVDRYGCELDNDGDGVVNSKDYCPDDSKHALSHGIAENGCPRHSDTDGTPDYRDKCPNTPRGVKTDQFGCPAIKLNS